jgi:hypothetical protein
MLRCLLWLPSVLRGSSCKRIRGCFVVIAEVAVSDFTPRGNRLRRPSRPAFSL